MSYSVSVIIPTYNRADVLPRAIDSVLCQQGFSNQNMEVLVIDDGSTDHTRQLIKQNYPDVSYHYQNNRGVSSARNVGLKRATHQWIALLDSDDEWLPNKLSSQIQLVQQANLKACHTEEIWIRNGVRVNQMKKHQKSGGWIFEHCLPLCAISPSSVLIAQSIIDDIGGFDESLPACEDYDLWLRLTAKYEVAFVEKPMIIKYGGHDDQLSRQYWGMDRFRVKALDKVLSNELSETYREAASAMLNNKLQVLLTGAQKHGNDELAADCKSMMSKWAL